MHDILMLMGCITITNYLFPMLFTISYCNIHFHFRKISHAHRKMIAIYYCSKCWWSLSFNGETIGCMWNALKHSQWLLYITNDALKYCNLALHKPKDETHKTKTKTKKLNENKKYTDRRIQTAWSGYKSRQIITRISFPLEKTKTCTKRSRVREREIERERDVWVVHMANNSR